MILSNPPLPFSSSWAREDALRAVQACSDVLSLLDVANRALSVGRQQWGDRLEEAVVSAHLWSTGSFAVSTAPTMNMICAAGVLEDVQGPKFLACSLEAAKLVASRLIQNRTLTENAALSQEVYEIGVKHGLWQAGLSPEQATSCATLLTGMDIEKALCTPVATQAYAQSKASSWDDLEALLPSTSSFVSASQKSSFQALVDQYGFSMVSVGPAGGAKQAQQSAREALSAVQSLSNITGLPPSSVGLDGLLLRLNATLENPVLGYHHKHTKAIAVTQGSGIFGHEWIHAVEEWAFTRSKDPNVIESAKKWNGKVQNLPPEIEKVKAWRHYAQSKRNALGQTITDHLFSQGSFLSRLAVQHGFLPPKIRKALDEAVSAVSDPDKNTLIQTTQRLSQAIQDHTHPKRASLPHSVLEDLLSKMPFAIQEEALFRDAVQNGGSYFSAVSRLQDLWDKQRYWSTSSEMLARAGEAFLSQAHNPDLVGSDSGGSILPQDQELVHSNQAFAEFFQTLRQILHPTPSDPSSSSETTQEELMVPLMGLHRVAGRREKAESSIEVPIDFELSKSASKTMSFK